MKYLKQCGEFTEAFLSLVNFCSMKLHMYIYVEFFWLQINKQLQYACI